MKKLDFINILSSNCSLKNDAFFIFIKKLLAKQKKLFTYFETFSRGNDQCKLGEILVYGDVEKWKE